MLKYFKRYKPSTGSHDPFESWPSIEDFQGEATIPSLFKEEHLTIPLRKPTSPQNDPQFSPALVIGLGNTGKLVIQQWSNLLAESSPSTVNLRSATILYNNNPTNLQELNIDLNREFNLLPQNGNVPYEGTHDSRAYLQACFNQVASYRQLKYYLINCVQELQKDVRVFIIGSVKEPIIGVIGNVLQLLMLIQNNLPYNSVSVLLTTSSPDNNHCLEDGDSIAALREIGRFSFKGIHVMEPAIGENKGMIDSNLIDYLFLFDSSILDKSSLPYIPFQEGSCQVLSETLFTLTHTANQKIWEHLNNDLANAAQIRAQIHDPVIHSCGIATLQIPFRELQEYTSSRLTRAVLYGENPAQDEGFVNSDYSKDQCRVLISKWMHSPPYDHRFFKWLIEAKRPPDLKHIPPIENKHVTVFINKISHHLTHYLDNPKTGGSLLNGLEVINLFIEHFDNINNILKKQKPSDLSNQSKQNLLIFIEEILYGLKSIRHQFEEWIEFFNLEFSNNTADLIAQEHQSTFSNPLERSTFTRKSGNQDAAKSQANRSLPEVLQKSIRQAEDNLKALAESDFRRSVIQGTSEEGEIKAFYLDVVRPELTSPNNISPFFNQVRERLGWWVRGDESESTIELLAVCLPSNWKSGDDKSQACYNPSQSDQFLQQVTRLCVNVSKKLELKLAPEWFEKRVDQHKNFLLRAQSPYLDYDRNEVAEMKIRNIAESRGYIIARNTPVASRYLNVFYQQLPRQRVNTVRGGEPWSLTAFEITTNIPLQVVTDYQKGYPSYKVGNFDHLYSQERNAKQYEKKIRELDWQNKDTQLSTRTVITLADESMVRLFFRSLFFGLIDKKRVNSSFERTQKWVISDFGDYDPRAIASAEDPKSLWHAFREFVLTIPNLQQNIGDPFHHDSKSEYLKMLALEVNRRSRLDEYKQQRKKVKNELLTQWQQMGKKDKLARDFALLMQVELDNIWDHLDFSY